MDPEIKNFSEIEKFIRSNPRQADVLAGKWHEFARLYPEVLQFESSEEFYAWTAENPNLHIDPDVWVGKEITDTYFYLRDQEEGGIPYQPTRPTPGIPLSGFGLPFLAAAYLAAPKIIEEDPDYQLIVEGKKQEWLENNPGKDLTSKEGLDYIYGSLEKDETASPLHQETEKEFRANPKYAKRVKRYYNERDKIYQNPKKDPALRQLSQTIGEHTRARFIHLQKENPDINLDAIQKQVEQRTYQAFVAKHQAKAQHYSLVNPQIKSVLGQRLPLEQKQKVAPPPIQITSVPQIPSVPTQTAGPSIPVAGPLSRGINFANRAGGLLSNPAQQLLGQGARTIAGMATRAGITALLPVWIPILVLIFILFSTFFIVGFAPVPGAPGGTGTPVGAPQQPQLPQGPPITPPPAPSDLRQAIYNQFGVTMNGFDRQHLQWAWEKLWDISRTKFTTLVRGTTITASGDSEQTGCRTILLAQYNPQELFNVALIHELGHIIRNCTSRIDAYWSEHERILSTEKGITRYAQTACTYNNPGVWERMSEDYAEMITYYLNPSADAQTARCAGRQTNPYLNNGYPLHYNVARKILGNYP